ncbi:hypothetical protein [Fusibacter bizertensis]
MKKSKSKTYKDMPSITKLENDLKNLKFPLKLFASKQYKEFSSIEDNLHNLVNNIDKYNERFSDFGWIAYDSINMKFVESTNKIFDNQGFTSAENEIINYYKSDEVKQIIQLLKFKSDEFLKRCNLIERAYNDHLNEKYYSSVPLFLIISDGIINDYTKRKGFFSAESTNECWDCLVGSDNGLQKLKDMYFVSRKKTNSDPITMPFRNGILHGRDINYDNIHVSSKCIVLLLAIGDWVENKKTEENRKEKFEKDSISKPLVEILRDYQNNLATREIITEWKSKQIVIDKDIPRDGIMNDYDGFEYIEKFIKLFEYWKSKNYGGLSNVLVNVFKYEKNERLHPKHCKELFNDLILINYEILEIEDRAICLKRILVEVEWEKFSRTYKEKLEFGVLYKSLNTKPALPGDNNGEWKLMPWNINGLYKI